MPITECRDALLETDRLIHVVASCISLATTFFKKSSCAHSVAPPFQPRPATLGSRLVFPKPETYFLESVRPFHVAADDISFAATFLQKSLLTHSVAAPLRIEPALLGFDSVFYYSPGYLFCQHNPCWGDKIDVTPIFLVFMRVLRHFRPPFQNCIYRIRP